MNRQQEQLQTLRAIALSWPADELGCLGAIEPTKGGASGSTFVARTSSQAFLLKVTRARPSLLRWRHRLLTSASEAGASPLVPLRVAGGSHLSTPVGRLEIYRYVQGSTESGNPRIAGTALAHLHVAFKRETRTAATKELRLIPRRLSRLLPQVEQLRQAVAGRLDLFPEDQDARAITSKLQALVALWHERLSYCRDVVWTSLPQQLIHGDFHAENLLWDQPRSCLIADFDKIAWGPRVYDLAKFIACTFVTHRGFRKRDAEAFVDGYQSVAPLSTAEMASIPELMRALSIGAMWVLEEYYLRGNGRVRPYIFEHATRLRAINWTRWTPPPALFNHRDRCGALDLQLALPFQ